MKEIKMGNQTLTLLEDRAAWSLLNGEGDAPTSFPCVMTVEEGGVTSYSYQTAVIASFTALEKGDAEPVDPAALERLGKELFPEDH